MKHFITLTFLMTCLSSKFAYSNEEAVVCQLQMNVADIAAYIIDTCEVSEETTKEEIESKITINDDTDGPGYKKLTFHFGEEYIGNQILIDYRNEEEVCYTENSSEQFCPTTYSN
jgi:hypothetical protein